MGPGRYGIVRMFIRLLSRSVGRFSFVLRISFRYLEDTWSAVHTTTVFRGASIGAL